MKGELSAPGYGVCHLEDEMRAETERNAERLGSVVTVGEELATSSGAEETLAAIAAHVPKLSILALQTLQRNGFARGVSDPAEAASRLAHGRRKSSDRDRDLRGGAACSSSSSSWPSSTSAAIGAGAGGCSFPGLSLFQSSAKPSNDAAGAKSGTAGALPGRGALAAARRSGTPAGGGSRLGARRGGAEQVA